MIMITGASSGIGEACARLFASKGRDLFLIARRGDRLDALRKELIDQHAIRCEIAVLDVSDRGAVETFAKKNAALLEQATVLINNAGLARGLSTFQEGSVDDWEAMIDTNVKGLLYVTRTVLTFFLSKNEGHIVNLGSVAGFFTYPKGNVYCATKAAVRSLTESLRIDLNGTAIRVTEVSPGMVQTEFSQVRLGDAERARAVYQGMTPLSAHDIAETIYWCIDRPKHVNIQEVILYPTDQASPTLVRRG